MTTLTAPELSSTGGLPRFGLGWVTWRQHRALLFGVGALLAALALFMLIDGLQVRSAFAGVAACRPKRSSGCSIIASNFYFDFSSTAQTMRDLLMAVPALIGVFGGGPLLAREMETGTFRFAWTQGCGRLRWVVTKLTLIAVALTAAAAAFSVLISWYYQPWAADGHQLGSSIEPVNFEISGAAFAAWTLAAFAIGAFVGVLIKRTVPAVATALAVGAGLILATPRFLRGHYLAPITARSSPDGAWVISRWWTDRAGKPASQAAIESMSRQAVRSGHVHSYHELIVWYSQHGLTQWFSYQPESRFWDLQLIEGGWLLALSLALLAATVWWVRHRAA